MGVQLCRGMNEIVGGLRSRRYDLRIINNNTKLPADINDLIASFLPEELRDFEVTVRGPVGSPYEGGFFNIQIHLPVRYPFQAPRIRFATRIFHMNVTEGGSFKLNPDLHATWSPAITIPRVIGMISAMLAKPEPYVVMDVRKLKLYKSDLEGYNATAREWTQRYAPSGHRLD